MRPQKQRQADGEREAAVLPACRLEVGAASQGLAASRVAGTHEDWIVPWSLQTAPALPESWPSPHETQFRLLVSRNIREYISVVQSHSMCSLSG